MPTDLHLQACKVSQHHRLMSYFSAFFPGATRVPRMSQGGSLSWGHSAQLQTPLLTEAFAERQQARVFSKRKKNERRERVCVCEREGMNG